MKVILGYTLSDCFAYFNKKENGEIEDREIARRELFINGVYKTRGGDNLGESLTTGWTKDFLAKADEIYRYMVKNKFKYSRTAGTKPSNVKQYKRCVLCFLCVVGFV
ncbi:MAG: hypothetical protein Q4G09_05085 [Clostridia bacterium]|nr:hypothetical protein [Clostridia bacterium]